MTTPDLPQNWQPIASLQDKIPPTHDWRSFGTLPNVPRYAISIIGQGVFDLERREFLKPSIERKRQNRRRYRLVTSDIRNGKRAPNRKLYYSVAILELVAGPRPSRRHQAHHADHDPTHDLWQNLSWATGKANRRMEADHRSRKGANNPHAKLSAAQLAEFIAFHDAEAALGRVSWDAHEARYGVKSGQLRRIAKGESRTDEVEAIRSRLKAQKAENNNPFLQF